jgi:Holliday junction resolvase RusA-like endonuclease
MADSVFFSGSLPIPPGINRSYKNFLNKKTGKSMFAGTPEARRFKQQAAQQLQDAQVDWSVVEAIQTAKKKHKQTPLEMTISFFYESRWRRDIDAGEKAAIDAVFKHLQLNDNLIVAKHTFKEIDKMNPRVELQLCIAHE